MNPVLWTTRRLVTSTSVIHRWNQAVTVYTRKIAAIAASDRQISIGVPGGTIPDATKNAMATIQATIAGRKKIQCALLEYSTFCRAAGYRRYNAPSAGLNCLND